MAAARSAIPSDSSGKLASPGYRAANQARISGVTIGRVIAVADSLRKISASGSMYSKPPTKDAVLRHPGNFLLRVEYRPDNQATGRKYDEALRRDRSSYSPVQEGLMPASSGKLSASEIRLIEVWVKDKGGPRCETCQIPTSWQVAEDFLQIRGWPGSRDSFCSVCRLVGSYFVKRLRR